jgi:hypothetical protein
MPGPWDDYAPKKTGPWNDYAPKKKPTLGDYARGLFNEDTFKKPMLGMALSAIDQQGRLQAANPYTQAFASPEQKAALAANNERAAKEVTADVQASGARLRAATPEIQNPFARGAYSAAQSLVQTAPAMVAGILTRSAPLALAGVGAQSYGDQYGDIRARGGGAGEAALGGIGTGAVEVFTELLPMGVVVSKFGKTGAKKFVAELLAKEVPGELAATMAQDAIDTAIANPDATWEEYWRSRPEALSQTLISTLVQGGVLGGVSKVASLPGEIRAKREAARTATAETPPAPETSPAPDVPLSPFEQAVVEVQARTNIPREDAEAMVRMTMPEPEQVEDVAGTDAGGLGGGVPSPDGEPVGGQPAGQPADAGRGDVGTAGGVDGTPAQRAESVEPALTPPSLEGVVPYAIYEAKNGENALSQEELLDQLDFLQELADRGKLTPKRLAQSDFGRTQATNTMMVLNKAVVNDPLGLVRTLRERAVATADITPPAQRAESVEPALTPPSMTDEEMLDAFEARDQEQEILGAEVTPPAPAVGAEIAPTSPEPTPQLPPVARVEARKAVLRFATDNDLTLSPPVVKRAVTAFVANPTADLATIIDTAKSGGKQKPTLEVPAPVEELVTKPDELALEPTALAPAPEGMVRLYRGETATPDTQSDIPEWVVESPEYQATRQATGRWFTESVDEARHYNTVHGDGTGKISYVDVPENELESYRVTNNPEAKKFSGRPEEEFFLPPDLAGARKELKNSTPEPTAPAPAPEPTIKEIPDTPYAPAWRALQAFEAARAPAEAVASLKTQIEGYDKLKSERKTPVMTPDMLARHITKRTGRLTAETETGARYKEGDAPTGPVMAKEDVEAEIDRVVKGVGGLRKWTGAPEIVVVDTFDQLPEAYKKAARGEQTADGEQAPSREQDDGRGIRGLATRSGKKVYIVADQHTDAKQVRITLFHEALGHAGLAKAFRKELEELLVDIYVGSVAIREAAAAWEKKNKGAYPQLSGEARTARVVEEVLAERSERGRITLPAFKRAIAAIRAFVRKYAAKMRWVETFTDDDIMAILAKAHKQIVKGPATTRTAKQPTTRGPDYADTDPRFMASQATPPQKAAKKSQEKLTLAAKKVANAAATAGELGYDNSAPAQELIDAFSGNIKARDAEAFVDEAATQPLSGWPVPVLNALVPQIPSAEIVRWAKTEGLELDPAYRLLTEMTGYHGRLQRASTRLGEDFNSWIGKNGSDVMSATMHYARLAGLTFSSVGDRATALQTDPKLVKLRAELANAAPDKQSAAKAQVTLREKDIRKGYDLWDALGQKKGGHEMYRRVHQFYADMYDLSRALIKQRIESMGLEPKDEAKLWQTVRLEMEQARDEGDYFPLMRNGKYYAYYKTSPVGRIFETFDTAGDRDKAVARYQKDFGIKPDGQGSNVNEMRNELTNESAMLRAMLDAVRKQSGGSPNIENLLDDTYQMFLQFLPERSLRKQFIHTKNGGVAGFSSDVARNFANMAGRYASQLPKLKYAHKVQAELDRADDATNDMPADLREKLGIFSGEVRRRAEQEFNPEDPNAALSVLNRATATFLLSGGATALAQTIAIPQRVLPHLTRYYGFGPTNRMALKYMQFWKMVGVNFGDFGRQGFGPSIGDSAYIKNNPVLKEIFDAGQDQFGLFESNASHYLDTAPSPTTPTGGLRGFARDITRAPVSTVVDATKRVADVTSRALMWTFSVSERLVNQQTFMMAAELELAKSGDKEKAKEAGVRAITDAIGRYQRYERPQIMRGTLGPTLTMFKMYPVHTTSFFIRNAATVAKEMSGGDPKAARAAALEMGYVLAMTGVFAGAVGMPLYSTITMVTDLVIKAMDDEEEEAERLAEDPFYGASSDLRFRYRILPGLFGDNSVELGGRKIPLSDVVRDGLVPTLTDAGIGSRASLDGIWFRPGQGDSTPSIILNTIAANLPGASFVTNFGRGYDLISQGEVEKGLEAMLPAGARNLLRATRFSEEGITTNRGDPILEPDEFTDANFLAQVLGLPVQRIAGRMDAGRKVKARSVQLGKDRQALLRRFNKLGRDPQVTDEQLDKLGADMRQFNATVSGVPKLLIDADALNRSWKSFEGRPVADGYVLDPRLGPYELEVLRDASSPE